MSNINDVILETKNLTKIYEKSNDKKVVACNNVNLKIHKGKTLGIVGESGSGKTTLVNMLMDLEKPTSGEILYHGRDISKFTKQEVWENRQNIQIVFQDPWSAFNPKMNVMQILTEPLMNYGRLKRSERKQKAIELLKMVDLPEEFVTKYPQNMSGGQRQRLGIARAISLEPEILICDEATSALDPNTTTQIIELLRSLQEKLKLTVVMITHQMEVVKSICNKVAVMEEGKIVEEGSLVEVFSEPKSSITKEFREKTLYRKEAIALAEKNKRNLYELTFIGEKANDPAIIMADEPTGNLDEKNEALVLDLLQELNRQGRTIVMVTHNPELGELTDRVIYLHHGKFVKEEIHEK